MAGPEKCPANLANLAGVPLSAEGNRLRQQYLTGARSVEDLKKMNEGDRMAWSADAYAAMSVVIDGLWRRMFQELSSRPVPTITPQDADWWNAFMGHYYQYTHEIEGRHAWQWWDEIDRKSNAQHTIEDKAYIAARYAYTKKRNKKELPIPGAQDLFLTLGSLAGVIDNLFYEKYGRKMSPQDLRGILNRKGVRMLITSKMVNSHDVSLDFHDKLIAPDNKGYDPRHFTLTDGPPDLQLQPGTREKYEAILKRNLPRFNPAKQHELQYTLKCPLTYTPTLMEKIINWSFNEAVRQYAVHYERTNGA